MATMYNEIDIRDILSNQRVRTVMPMLASVNVTRSKNTWKPLVGSLSKTKRYKTASTDMELIVIDQVARLSRRVARPYYNRLSVTKTANNVIRVNGDIKYSLPFVYNSILRGLTAKNRITLLERIIKHTPIIQEVYNQVNIKKTTREERQDPEYKVTVRASSVGEIEKMNARQLANLEQDIINSIKFGGGFQDVKKALGYDTEVFKARSQHERDMWLKKVSRR